MMIIPMTEKGSFFKAHKDTPRADNMFASLVIVFATPHDGGALVLRHKDEEWTFDSAKELAASKSSVGFVAFYSDVEHEVMPVTSGYRVTLTYNLYLDAKAPISEAAAALASATSIANPIHSSLKVALEALLADPTFLPNGGRVGFGLSHQYPVSKPEDKPVWYYGEGEEAKLRAAAAKRKPLETLLGSLKGSDATVYSVCKEMSLESGLRIIYDDEECHVMMDHAVNYRDYEMENAVWYELKADGGEFVWASQEAQDKYQVKVDAPVEWITPQAPFNKVEANFIAYGNEASQGCIYGDLCLIVQVGAFGERATAKTSA